MRKNSLTSLSHILLVALFLISAAALLVEKNVRGELVFARRRLALLETENARLRSFIAEQEKAREKTENITRRAEIERATSGIRQLPFKNPVTYDVLTRGEIQKVISQKLSEQDSDEEIKNAGIALAAFGLLPRDYPLKEKYVALLGEQVAAFYDQHQHKLFMFEDAALSSAQNRVILSHELTHALQDQNFGLQKLPLEIKNNDDRAAAASALIEGDATLVMTQYMTQDFSLQSLRETVLMALTQNMEQLQNAPRFLREMLVFPYLKGQEFCAAVLARGGWQALDAAYKNPPSSTSQILHPEKFFANEQPVAIDFEKSSSDSNDLNVNGEKPLEDNVLGELGIRILISQYVDMKTAESVASGWRGDRYLVFLNGDALVWRTSWSSADAARLFLFTMQAVLEKRYDLARQIERYPPSSRAPASDKIRNPRLSNIGNDVVLIDAKDKKWADALWERFVKTNNSSPR